MFRILLTIILSCFASVVMSYISMAVPVGPWIETTLVLLGMLMFTLRTAVSERTKITDLGLATAAGGIGGILATGMGFSLPTLFFVDNALFTSWLMDPVYFCVILGAVGFSAGTFGLAVAQIFEYPLLIKQEMPFAIGELVQKVIIAQNQVAQTVRLAVGFVGTGLLLYAQRCSQFIAQQFTILNKLHWSIFTIPQITIKTELIPMFLAVGFVTGHLIAAPLAIGFLSKILILDPLFYIYTHADTSVHSFFVMYLSSLGSWLSKIVPLGNAQTGEEFTVAFCSGMVIYGVIISFLGFPKALKEAWEKLMAALSFDKLRMSGGSMRQHLDVSPVKLQSGEVGSARAVHTKKLWPQVGIALVSSILFLTYFKFSVLSQLYLLVFTFIWTYQVLNIAGKMGIAPLGRFATFVMVPGMLFFGFSGLQATLVATFVEITVGVASDTLFGRKMAQLTQIEHKQIVHYQWLGLLISTAIIGLVFWLLITHFGIGPETDLSVVKAQSRALLINSKNFDFLVLFFGIIFGYILTYFKTNPALVLGGILMPAQYSLLLIAGGLLTYFVKEKEEYFPFWSGVFAANSVWMLIQTFFKSVVCR